MGKASLLEEVLGTQDPWRFRDFFNRFRDFCNCFRDLPIVSIVVPFWGYLIGS